MIFRIIAVQLFFFLFLNLGMLLAQTSTSMRFSWDKPVNLSEINSADDDFAPSWNNSEYLLYFNSMASGYSVFFTARFNDTSAFTGKSIARWELSAIRQNRSYITFSGGNEAFLSAYRLSKARSYLNIFRIEKVKQAWTTPAVVESLADDSFTAHPAISADGTYIVFSSDRGESADTDLWIAYRNEDGSFGSLIRLDELNSPGNEITPYLSPGDTLFFASNGQYGPGGYDLFFSVKTDGIWERPQPLNELNTEYDESDFIVLPWGAAIFASNRPGGKGELDLYYTFGNFADSKIVSTSQIELSLATQTSSIKSRKFSKTSYLPVSQYIFMNNKNEIDLSSVYMKSEISVPNNLTSIDSVYYYSPLIIANRLKANPKPELYAFRWVATEGESAGMKDFPSQFLDEKKKDVNTAELTGWQKSIDDFFGNFCKGVNNCVVFGKQLYRGSVSETNNYIQLFSRDFHIFSPYIVSRDSISIIPSVLEVFSEGRPAAAVVSWQCSMSIDTIDCGIVARGDKIGGMFTVDLNNYKDLIAKSDSLVLTLIAADSAGSSHTKNLKLEIARTESVTPFVKKINGKMYEEFFLFIINSRHFEIGASHREILAKVTESLALSRNVSIQYFSQDGKQTAEQVKKILEQSSVRPLPQIIAEQGASDCCAEFGIAIAPNVIRIMLERN